MQRVQEVKARTQMHTKQPHYFITDCAENQSKTLRCTCTDRLLIMSSNDALVALYSALKVSICIIISEWHIGIIIRRQWRDMPMADIVKCK